MKKISSWQLSLVISCLGSFLAGLCFRGEVNQIEIVSRSAKIGIPITECYNTKNPDDKSVTHSTGEKFPVQLDLKGAAAGDRQLPRTTVDLYYALHHHHASSPSEQEASKVLTINNTSTRLSFDWVMKTLHGDNVWQDNRLGTILDLWDLRGKGKMGGSPILEVGQLRQRIQATKPRLLMEVGVYLGASSILMASILDDLSENDPILKDSFVVSVDSWLLDLSYAWPAERRKGPYFQKSPKVAGHEFMYFVFMANVIQANMTHRIVPLPSASTNAVLAFLQHGIMVDLLYLDASHANPDVFLDLVGYWQIIAPGGLMIVDDYPLDPVKQSIDSFLNRFAGDISQHSCSRQCWIYKK